MYIVYVFIYQKEVDIDRQRERERKGEREREREREREGEKDFGSSFRNIAEACEREKEYLSEYVYVIEKENNRTKEKESQ